MADTYTEIEVEKINLFKENPRFEPVKSDQEALFALLDDKLYELAKDITQRGLNPGDPPYIIEDENNSGRYIVLEGNRRIACLKILNTPSLIKDFSEARYFKKFTELHQTYKRHKIKNLKCVLYDSFKEAAPWIERKHVGESGGKGTVKWESIQSNRFNRLLTGKASLELQVADFVKAQFPDIGKDIDKLPITSLERLLNDKYVRKEIGLEIRDNVAYCIAKIEEVAKPLGKIVSDLIEGNISVTDIYHAPDRKKYIDNLEKEYKPDLTKKLTTPKKLDPVSTVEPATKSKKRKKKKSPLERVTVIFHGEDITANDTKLEQLIYELKTINAANCPIAASFLLRSLLELSVHKYLTKFKITTKNDQLNTRTVAVITDIESKKNATKQELKGIESWVKQPESWCSINSLNAVVHNSSFTIPLSTLISGFENIKPFLIIVWRETFKK